MKRLKQIKEMTAMSVGGGMQGLSSTQGTPIAGYDTMLMGNPMRRKKFAGKEVFVVNSNSFNKAKLGKKKFEHYSSYVGKDEIGEQIREYAKNNPDEPIILEDETTGAMVYLRYGKR
jgi:hypothetical protein